MTGSKHSSMQANTGKGTARRSRALQPTFFKQLRTPTLGACQFPSLLTDAKGEIRKPERW